MAKSKKIHKKSSQESMAHHIFDDVIDMASTLFRNRKVAGADRLKSLAEATHNYAAAMTDLPTLQRQVTLASENIENFAEYVLNTDIKHMVSDTIVLARRRPLFTLGITALAGLAATRLVTSTSMPIPPTTRRRSLKKKAKKSKPAARRTINGVGDAHP